MKLFFKIVFFIFTMIISTAGEVRSFAVGTILQEETSYSFLENRHTNSWLDEEIEGDYTGGGEAFRIWTYNYEDFALLIKELGYSISREQQRKLITEYKTLLTEFGDDCNKLDVLYENIPDFVAHGIDDNEMLLSHLELLNSCAISSTSWITESVYNTNEQKAILNLLDIFDKDWFVRKIDTSPNLFEEILVSKLSNKNATQYMTLLSTAAQSVWTTENYDNAPFVLLQPLDDDGSLYLEYGDVIPSNSKKHQTVPVLDSQTGVYKFGISYGEYGLSTTEENIRRLSSSVNWCDLKAMDAVVVDIDGELQVLPAICAKYILLKGYEEHRSELRGLVLGLIMPELAVARNTSVARYSKVRAVSVARGGKILIYLQKKLLEDILLLVMVLNYH